MREIGVAQIASNNPMLRNYLKTISTWDAKGSFADTLNNNEVAKSIFCVFYGDIFLGASTLLIDPTSMEANACMVIGSRGHKEEIEEYFTEHLKNVALTQYGVTNIVFNGYKEEPQKLLVK